MNQVQDKSCDLRLAFFECDIELCCTFADITEADHNRGDRQSAARSLRNAVGAYAGMVRFLSDPEHGKHLTEEQHRAQTAKLDVLHARLEGLRSKVTKMPPMGH